MAALGWASRLLSGGLEVGAAAGGAALTAAGLTIPSFLTAKLLTSPRFVRWLTNGMKIVGDDATSLNRHLTRLISVQASEPHLKEELQQYRDAMRTAPRTMTAAVATIMELAGTEGGGATSLFPGTPQLGGITQ